MWYTCNAGCPRCTSEDLVLAAEPGESAVDSFAGHTMRATRQEGLTRILQLIVYAPAGLAPSETHKIGEPMKHKYRAKNAGGCVNTSGLAVQAKVAEVADRLLWLDGFQSAKALTELLLCGAAFVAPFDEQSPTSVSRLKDTFPITCSSVYVFSQQVTLLVGMVVKAVCVVRALVSANVMLTMMRCSSQLCLPVSLLRLRLCGTGNAADGHGAQDGSRVHPDAPRAGAAP